MSQIQVEIRDGATSFRPGEVVEGSAFWQLATGPREVVARLIWYTRGKGTQDVAVVEELAYDAPAPSSRQPFRFRLPAGPFSFSGTLISLVWAVEVLAQPGEVAGRAEITVSPTGEEIRLQPIADKPQETAGS